MSEFMSISLNIKVSIDLELYSKCTNKNMQTTQIFS